MSEVAIVDTTVFLNVLDVPGCNQDRDMVMDQFEELVVSGANLLLPRYLGEGMQPPSESARSHLVPRYTSPGL